MVFDFGQVGALAVSQAGKLFGITEDEFDLEAEAVSVQNPLPVFAQVGAEIKFMTLQGAI